MKRSAFVLFLAAISLVRCGMQNAGDVEKQNKSMLGTVREAQSFSEFSHEEMRKEADRITRTGPAKLRADARVLAEAAPHYEALAKQVKGELSALRSKPKDTPGHAVVKRERLKKIGRRFRDLLTKTKPAYQNLYNADYLRVGEVEAKQGSAYRMLEAHNKLLEKLGFVPK